MSRRSGRFKIPVAESNKSPEPDDSPEVDEQGEITRCICRNDEIATINAPLERLLFLEYGIKIDNGLFIQCDECLVWQHGYCVGLFIDHDVPDKYWCEECKPVLHIFVTDPLDQSTRTLYRPVNDERKSLLRFSKDPGSGAAKSASEDAFEKYEPKSEKHEKPSRLRSHRSPVSPGTDLVLGAKGSDLSHMQNLLNRQTRKERRHGDDAFDEQLQRALRESAASTERRRNLDPNVEIGNGNGNGNKRVHSEDLENDVNDSHMEDNTDPKVGKREVRGKNKLLRGKQKARALQGSRGSMPQPKYEEKDALTVSKEELLSQPSKPRFVNEKLTIYELRKRTGAILEWLCRSQMELEEERDVKTLQFNEANVEGANLLLLVDENSKLLEKLIEKVLAWEQRFGKYAP